MSTTFVDEITDVSAPGRLPGPLYQHVGKRALDLAVVALVAPFVVPLILVLWAVMVIDGGSGFYRQPRIGRGGRVFTCWKIRTMAPDADRILAQYLKTDARLAQEWHKHQKLKNDPRITRFGRLLRRTSLDELPQLWNVLLGDMSLIGARPFTPDQRALYDREAVSASYYRLRPGISGLWQVESRNQGVFADRVKYDETYSANLSLINDLKIGFKTLIVMMRATGT